MGKDGRENRENINWCAVLGAQCMTRAQSIGQNSPLVRASCRCGCDTASVQEVLGYQFSRFPGARVVRVLGEIVVPIRSSRRSRSIPQVPLLPSLPQINPEHAFIQPNSFFGDCRVSGQIFFSRARIMQLAPVFQHRFQYRERASVSTTFNGALINHGIFRHRDTAMRKELRSRQCAAHAASCECTTRTAYAYGTPFSALRINNSRCGYDNVTS